MTTIALPNWNHLPDLHDVHDELSGEDKACLTAVSAVLAQFGRLGRFGVTLLHKHFDVAPDEILAEFVDEKGRRLETKPVKIADVAADLPGSYETQWTFGQDLNGQVYNICIVRCFGAPQGHPMKHVGW